MKSTGIVRKIDELGRIVLPIELRRLLDVGKDSSLEIYTDNDRIILKKYLPACIFCGKDDGILNFQGRSVCEVCRNAISAINDEAAEKQNPSESEYENKSESK